MKSNQLLKIQGVGIMSENLLMKVYPYIAKQIVDDYEIEKGICLVMKQELIPIT